MQFIQLLIERFVSPNPKLFKILALISGLSAGIIQLIFWLDHYLIFAWLSEAWQGILNDTEFTCFGVFTASQLTTNKRYLQSETEDALTKNKHDGL